ncbi:BLUF domain-containing protein [Simplicispira psychrophila]|uniref:BLUF domain-containing protein n=1 Tax=Simplicispira psychrophila TaxID=80882 RepID=UPI00047F2207|nr:BLUF domain-containing protein [Simplicispira psychrophila]
MTSSLNTLYEVLYVSVLAPGAPVSAVAEIAGHARAANAQRGITGLLVFDGNGFCQQLEGTQKNVLSAMERISQDARHVQISVVHHGPLTARRFSDFSLAFSPAEDADTLAALALLDGEAALQAFHALRASVLL